MEVDELFISIKRKNSNNDFLILADPTNGNVKSTYITAFLNDIVNSDNINLDELLILFQEKHSDEFDFTDLKDSVFDHDCDIYLRDTTLQLTALKLLYSKNTTPENGYERAKRFINEFNKKLNLNLNTCKLDKTKSKSLY